MDVSCENVELYVLGVMMLDVMECKGWFKCMSSVGDWWCVDVEVI